jgi:hypothetical protein
MAKADSVHSTPPTNTSAIGHPMFPPHDPTADKRAADIAHGEAIDAEEEAEEHGIGLDEASDHCWAACHAAHAIDWKLATTLPTTLAGVAAVLRFANEIEDGGMEWPNTDAIGPDGWHYQLRTTVAAAIEALIKAPAGKAVQS